MVIWKACDENELELRPDPPVVSKIRQVTLSVRLSRYSVAFRKSTMDFPPEEWVVFPAEEFTLAQPRNPGVLGAEVMAQMCANGRIKDYWRVALCSSEIQEASFALSTLLPAPTALPNWIVLYKQFPRDINIRRNMVSSEWADALALLASHEFTVADPEGEPVDLQRVNQAVKDLPAKQNQGASIHWSVTVSAAGQLELQLQALPSSANNLGCKPIFTR